MARQETRRNGVLAQYFEFVRTMTDGKSTTPQKVIGTTVGVVPMAALLLLSVALFMRVQQLDLTTLLWILGAGGFSVTSYASARRWLDRRHPAASRRLDNGGDDPRQESDRAAGEDREQMSDDTIGT